MPDWKAALAGVLGAQAAIVLAHAASAHPGHHDGLAASEALEHFASAWHALPMLALAAGAIAVAVAHQRRRQAAANARGSRRGDKR
jgi:hypothetical protein